MKRMFIYATLSAIALGGAIGFTGCSSDDDIVEQKTDNPTYNPVDKTVTTQFVLNVSSAASGTTRQSSTMVQRNGNFRGLQDAKLIGLATDHSTWLAPFDGTTTTTNWSATSGIKTKTYDLGTLYGATAVNNTDNNNADNSSRRVLELTLPLKTDAMLVYARAIPNGTDEENGKVTANITTNPENITFDLVSRLDDRQTRYTETCNLAALIINRIIKSEVGEAAAGVYTHAGHTNEAALPAISWRGIGKTLKDGGSLPPLQENLATVYNSLTTLGTNEVRAGSASAVCSIIYHIYETITTTLAATPTTDGELNAQRLAETIKTRIENYFDVESTETATAFRNIGDASTANTIINGLVTASVYADKDAFDAVYGQVVHGDLMGFPTSFKLPLGAAQLYFTDFNADATTGGFSYTNPSTSLLDLSATIAPTHYMYPSELLYFDNSPLYVSDAEKTADNYPNGYNTWDTYSWTSNGWSNNFVTSTTRSVAVKNNINYGVAMLQTQVALNGTTFNDNRHAIVTSESDQSLTEAEVKKMQLTGIIIGGQNHQLGWNYLAKANETTDWDYAIFDNQIESSTIPTGANYTLVFDNYRNGDQTAQTDVLVALEFQNNSDKDFYGKGNLIRKGGKFYLIGKLELGTKLIGTDNGISGSATAWPTNYPIPPYTDAGASKEITRVFIQDYLTTATFKIGANSLKNAFITVPDLRSTQTSLGLSVDLNWREGLNFEANL
ncbi:MAG: hypothetical protein IJP70_08705 [Bacteroidales bacterium]|nr:hypothetical protein [Bacteroidales bacterium]